MAQNILIDMTVMLSFNHTPAINYLLRAIYSRGSHRLRYIFAAVHNIAICIYKYARGPWNGLRCRNGFLEANWCTVHLANPGSNLAIRTRRRPLRGHHLSRYDGTTQNTCHDQIFCCCSALSTTNGAAHIQRWPYLTSRRRQPIVH